MSRVASTKFAVARILGGGLRSTAATPDREAAISTPHELSAASDYFVVAATPRFRASQRARVRESARHGMALAIGTAILDCLWLGPLHPNALALTVVLNVTVALVAAAGFVAITRRARPRPEPFVLVTLATVDAATISLGIVQPELGMLTVGYLLLLPLVAALVLLWQTRIHVGWLAVHGAAVLGYAAFAPSASLAGGTRGDLFTLLAVATGVSLFGHVVGLRARVLGFVQIERIRALNRQTRRGEARLDRLNRILEQTVRTDELTGLKNRLSLKLDVGIIRSQIARYGERYAVLVLDLDRFKAINDQLGHVAGDRVLRAIAESLMSVSREEDGVYRYGGEEFVVLMRLTGPRDGILAAERLRAAIADLHLRHPANPPHDRVTVSVGVATIGQEDLATDDDGWFARADAALYRAKARGRNTCESEIASMDSPRVAPSTGEPSAA